jgi:hypothetical protein
MALHSKKHGGGRTPAQGAYLPCDIRGLGV